MSESMDAGGQALTPEGAHNALATVIALYAGILADQARLRRILHGQLEVANKRVDALQIRVDELVRALGDANVKVPPERNPGFVR
ncbi:MAG: hypothetical protein WBY94_06640 [Polyangiaceae bacterium]